MSDPMSRHYTSDEVSAIVRRALNGRPAETNITYDELVETARELNISPARLREAIEEQEREGQIDAERERAIQRRRFYFFRHLRTYLIFCGFFLILNLLTGGDVWFYWPWLGWGLFVAFHASRAFYPSQGEIEREARYAVKRRERRERHERHRR